MARPVPPFFVVGTPRSGTTLLQGMLASHSQICIPPETFLFSKVLPRVRLYVKDGHILSSDKVKSALASSAELAPILSGLDEADWDELLQAESTLCGLVDGILNAYAARRERLWWGDKTPSHLWYWRDIDRCFPECRFIAVVRDGRDVVASLADVPWGARSAWANAYRWRREMRSIESLGAALGPSRVFRMTYEALVNEPSETIAQVCSFLGVRCEPGMLDAQLSVDEYIHPFERGWKARNKESLFKTSVGRHRVRFGARMVQALTIFMWPELERLGYTQRGNAPGWVALRALLGAYGFCGFAWAYWPTALRRRLRLTR